MEERDVNEELLKYELEGGARECGYGTREIVVDLDRGRLKVTTLEGEIIETTYTGKVDEDT